MISERDHLVWWHRVTKSAGREIDRRTAPAQVETTKLVCCKVPMRDPFGDSPECWANGGQYDSREEHDAANIILEMILPGMIVMYFSLMTHIADLKT